LNPESLHILKETTFNKTNYPLELILSVMVRFLRHKCMTWMSRFRRVFTLATEIEIFATRAGEHGAANRLH